jgi:hypothetical protein
MQIASVLLISTRKQFTSINVVTQLKCNALKMSDSPISNRKYTGSFQYSWNSHSAAYSKTSIYCHMTVSTMNYFLYSSQFYWCRKPAYPEKTTNLPQVTDKLYHIMLYTSPWSRFELTASVVIGTDCIGSCKLNYHVAPLLRLCFLMILRWKDFMWKPNNRQWRQTTLEVKS